MKKTKKQLLRVSLFLFNLLLPVLAYSQNNGQSPDPFDDAPPDFDAPTTPIDSFAIYLFLVALLVAFYFLVLKKNKNSINEIQ